MMQTIWVASPSHEEALLEEFSAPGRRVCRFPEDFREDAAPPDLAVLDLRRCLPDDDSPGALLAAYDDMAVWLFAALRRTVPHLRRGRGKRVAVLTTPTSSNSLCRDVGRFAEHMPLAACNMLLHLVFNQLRPEGFTFRLLAVGDSVLGAAEYCLTGRSFEEDSPKHSDENRLALRDLAERELPF